MSKLSERVQARIAEFEAKRDEIATELNAIATDPEARGLDDDAALARIAELRAAGEKVAADLAAAADQFAAAADAESRQAAAAAVRPAAASAPAKVKSEPRTYSPQTEREGRSFFVDAFAAQVSGDWSANERIQRHLREVTIEREARQAASLDTEQRAASSGYAGLVVPQYLVDQAALALRNGRPLANLVKRLPLPDEGMSFLLPRGTTGATTAVQATENTAVSNTDQVFANVTLPVATIAGQQDVSRQSLERGTPMLDSLIWADLAGAYHANVDTQIISGSGASGQVLGIQNTASINTATAFGAAVTTATFNSKIAGQIAAVTGVGAQITARLIVMHPRRWGWLTAQVDTAGRPLVVPVVNGAFNALAVNSTPGEAGGTTPLDVIGANIVGYLHGLPVVTDPNIPTTVGTPQEDLVFILDTNHMLLFEIGDGQPQMLRFEQTLGGSLTVKMVAYSYAAFTAGRYPQAVGRVGGADTVASHGLSAPSF